MTIISKCLKCKKTLRHDSKYCPTCAPQIIDAALDLLKKKFPGGKVYRPRKGF